MAPIQSGPTSWPIGGGPARKLTPGERQRRAVRLRIGLAMAGSAVRSHRVQETVIIAVIGGAALARLARENQIRALARLVAWDKRQGLRERRKARAA